MDKNRIEKGPHNKTISNLLTFMVSLLFTFLMAEIILFNFTDLRKDEMKVWIDEKKGRGSGMCYTSNKNGYFPLILKHPITGRRLYCIIYDIDKRKAGYFTERKKQAAIVGDSFVFGEGVKGEDTLGYLLGMKFTGINFRNFGVIGADIRLVRGTIEHIIKEEKQIKDIIYFYNLNDVIMSDKLTSHQKYIFDFQNIRWFNVEKHHWFITNILSKSTIFCLIKKAFILRRETKLTIKNYLDMYFDASNQKELKRTIDLLVSMNKIAEDNDVRFHVVIYPLLYKDNFGRYPFVSIHNFLKDICKEHSISCIDAYPAFRKYRSFKKFIVHPIDYHPNGSANKIVVDWLAEEGEINFRPSRD